MSLTTYKAWLQNNGFVQSFEKGMKDFFELRDQTEMGKLDEAWDKAGSCGVMITKSNYNGFYGIRILEG